PGRRLPGRSRRRPEQRRDSCRWAYQPVRDPALARVRPQQLPLPRQAEGTVPLRRVARGCKCAACRGRLDLPEDRVAGQADGALRGFLARMGPRPTRAFRPPRAGAHSRLDPRAFVARVGENARVDNVAIARSSYEAFGRHDLDGALSMMDDDIEWHQAQGLPH